MTQTVVRLEESREVQTREILSKVKLENFFKYAAVSAKSEATYKTVLKQLAKFFTVNGINRPIREDLETWRDALNLGTIDGNGVIHHEGEIAPDGRVYRFETINEEKKFCLVDAAGKAICLEKSPRTVQLYIMVARLFFRWLAMEKIYPDISEHLKSGAKQPDEHAHDALEAKQAGQLIQGVSYVNRKNKKHNTLREKRDKALIALMCSCGLRCIEVCRADIGDLDDNFGKTWLKIQGKGDKKKEAKVLVPSQVAKLIRDYLQARNDKTKSAPLFCSTANRNRGSRMSPQTISKMIKGNLRKAGFDSPTLTAHSLRATAATTMLLCDVRLDNVKTVLRHRRLETTMIYNRSVERLKLTAEQIAADSIFATITAGGNYGTSEAVT